MLVLVKKAQKELELESRVIGDYLVRFGENFCTKMVALEKVAIATAKGNSSKSLLYTNKLAVATSII
jgi:hypothetical protein